MKTIAMPSSRSLRMTAKSCCRLVDGEARGRLVEHEHVGGRDHERPRDRRHLLDRDGVGAERAGHVDLDVEALQDLASPAVHPVPVDAAPAPRFATDQQVLGHRQVRAEVDLLVDGADPELLGVERRSDGDLLAIEGDRARVGSLDAGQDLDQGGLACAVLPDQRVDLAAGHREVDVAECLDAREGLVDAFHHDDVGVRFGHHGPQRVANGAARGDRSAASRPARERGAGCATPDRATASTCGWPGCPGARRRPGRRRTRLPATEPTSEARCRR